MYTCKPRQMSLLSKKSAGNIKLVPEISSRFGGEKIEGVILLGRILVLIHYQ